MQLLSFLNIKTETKIEKKKSIIFEKKNQRKSINKAFPSLFLKTCSNTQIETKASKGKKETRLQTTQTTFSVLLSL